MNLIETPYSTLQPAPNQVELLDSYIRNAGLSLSDAHCMRMLQAQGHVTVYFQPEDRQSVLVATDTARDFVHGLFFS